MILFTHMNQSLTSMQVRFKRKQLTYLHMKKTKLNNSRGLLHVMEEDHEDLKNALANTNMKCAQEHRDEGRE